MGGVDQAAHLLKEGRSVSEISQSRQVSLSTVLDYLDRAVGKGYIRRSEIYSSVPSHSRELVEKVKIEQRIKVRRDYDGYCHQKPFVGAFPHENPDDVQVTLRYGPAARYYGDLYEELRGFEVDLHRFVRDVLQREFGSTGRDWWYQGVDDATRRNAVTRTEDLRRADYDPWHCVDLTDLSVTAGKQWALFSPHLRRAGAREFKSEIAAVNQIRNRVMHPVRDMPPEEHDFDCVRAARSNLDAARARFYGEKQAGATRTE